MFNSRIVVRGFAPILVGLVALTTVAAGQDAAPREVPKRIALPKVVDPEGEALKLKVIEGIRRNYSRLPVVRCRQVMTTIDPSVDKPEVIRAAVVGNDDAFAEIHVAPRSTIDIDLVLAGDSMRADFQFRETGRHHLFSMHEDIWMSVSDELAEKTYRENMAGEMNIDPRNVGVFLQRKKFLEELQRSSVARHETVQRDGKELLAFDLTDYYSYQGTVIESTARYEFDPARNHLPVRFLLRDPMTKKITWVHDFDYQEVIPGSAWFLKKGRVRSFSKMAADTPDGDGSSREQLTLVGPVHTEGKVTDKDFDLFIPTGARYSDMTKNRARPASDR